MKSIAVSVNKPGALRIAAITVLSLALFTSLVYSAFAAESSTVTTAVLTSANATTTSAAIGTSVHAWAQVTTASTTLGVPTGTVDFASYTNTSCTGATTTQSSVALVNGVAVSGASVVPATGLSFKAHYNGLTDVLTPTDGVCMSVATSTTPTGTGVLSGQVYNDLNKNGIKDAGEVGLAGWKINLFKGSGWWKFGAPIQTVTTAADGTYTFAGVADGTYSVEQVITPGWSQLTDDFNNVVIASGASKSGLDFGDAQKGSGKKSLRENKMRFKHHWRGEGQVHASDNKLGKRESHDKDD